MQADTRRALSLSLSLSLSLFSVSLSLSPRAKLRHPPTLAPSLTRTPPRCCARPQQLKHDNIVNLIEVFRRKSKLHLVFEYVERTILEDLERNPDGMDPIETKKCLWQLLRSIDYCHAHNIIHRDIKPENLLISRNGILKLCDFGFARTLAGPGARYTDYVATRWYRGPELLTGDTQYGKAVDIWAIGCMLPEMASGAPLFPGESDIDQLFHIMRCFGQLPTRLMEVFRANPLFIGIKIPDNIQQVRARRKESEAVSSLSLLFSSLLSLLFSLSRAGLALLARR